MGECMITRRGGGEKNIPPMPCFFKFYTTSQEFIVPYTGKYRIIAIGAGGNGGDGTRTTTYPRTDGGGGGSGAVGVLVKKLSKGEKYSLVVTGEASFGTLISAKPGLPGERGSSGDGPNHGAGGTVIGVSGTVLLQGVPGNYSRGGSVPFSLSDSYESNGGAGGRGSKGTDGSGNSGGAGGNGILGKGGKGGDGYVGSSPYPATLKGSLGESGGGKGGDGGANYNWMGGGGGGGGGGYGGGGGGGGSVYEGEAGYGGYGGTATVIVELLG